jgi:hypothetical protein
MSEVQRGWMNKSAFDGRIGGRITTTRILKEDVPVVILPAAEYDAMVAVVQAAKDYIDHDGPIIYDRLSASVNNLRAQEGGTK